MRFLIIRVLTLALGILSAGLALYWVVDAAGIAPRALAPYVERRAEGHNPTIVGIGQWLSRSLRSLDRGAPLQPETPRYWRSPVPAPEKGLTGRLIAVGSADEARLAIEKALPGDIITFAPGTYRFGGGNGYILVKQPGQPGREITVRAERAGTVLLEFNLVEGFLVAAPYWTFENLGIRGVCKDHSDCEHAFHVVAGANHFVARDNTIMDFNAQFKINASGGAAPDHGLLEGNMMTNSGVRNTANPVTPIDLVAASHWMIRGNRISDFVKRDGNQVSYGAFAKGAGRDNRFEQNLVVCENRLRDQPGARVGLSLGGGGTDKGSCRDGQCKAEQFGGVIQSNLIVSCSDDGIYLNQASASIVRHNTLIDTGPLVVRFPASSADVDGNLVDSAILARNGASLHQAENLQTAVPALYLGWHPVRRLFADARALDLRWQASPPLRQAPGVPPPDFCGGLRPLRPAYGAAEDYSRCLTTLR